MVDESTIAERKNLFERLGHDTFKVIIKELGAQLTVIYEPQIKQAHSQFKKQAEKNKDHGSVMVAMMATYAAHETIEQLMCPSHLKALNHQDTKENIAMLKEFVMTHLFSPKSSWHLSERVSVVWNKVKAEFSADTETAYEFNLIDSEGKEQLWRHYEVFQLSGMVLFEKESDGSLKKTYFQYTDEGNKKGVKSCLAYGYHLISNAMWAKGLGFTVCAEKDRRDVIAHDERLLDFLDRSLLLSTGYIERERHRAILSEQQRAASVPVPEKKPSGVGLAEGVTCTETGPPRAASVPASETTHAYKTPLLPEAGVQNNGEEAGFPSGSKVQAAYSEQAEKASSSEKGNAVEESQPAESFQTEVSTKQMTDAELVEKIKCLEAEVKHKGEKLGEMDEKMAKMDEKIHIMQEDIDRMQSQLGNSAKEEFSMSHKLNRK